MDGLRTKYIPDVRVNFVDGTIGRFEVKPSTRLLNHKVKLKIDALNTHFESTDRRFHIATEKLILATPMADTLLTLMYHRRGPDVTGSYHEELKYKFRHHPSASLNDRIQTLGPQEAWRLLSLGYIGINLQKNPKTLIFGFMNGVADRTAKVKYSNPKLLITSCIFSVM